MRQELQSEHMAANTRSVLSEVANHRLDPYAAADELFGLLTHPA
jgi:hypothetical protein